MRTNKPWRLGTRAKLLLRGLRYASLLPYASIDGWLSVDEAITLYELSRSLPHEQPLAVEIGSWQGKSSVCLARGLAGKFQPRLCCIDRFDARDDDEGPRHVLEDNLREVGVRNLVDVRQGLSDEQARTWREPIDLLFLGGNQANPAMTQDFVAWAKHLRPGGFLAMHAGLPAESPEPHGSVEALVRSGSGWVDARTVDSLFIARKAMV